MAVRLAVDPNEDLEQLIAKLKAQPAKEVTLVLPQESRALQTLDNFYALRNAARTTGTSLSVTGGNKTIRGLAKLLGFTLDKEGDENDALAGPPPTSAPPMGNGASAPPSFNNAATIAMPTPNVNGGGGSFNSSTPFGMPDGGYVVSQPGQESVPPPAQNRNAQDFFAEMQNFNPGIPAAPLQPPPSTGNDPFGGNGFGGGDQVMTRENIPDFFGSVATPPPTRSNPPPPPKAEFDLEGGRTMSFEEATKNGLFGPGGIDTSFNPTGLDEVSGPMDEDVPEVPMAVGGDTAADRFRRGGVRNIEDGGKKTKTRNRPARNSKMDKAAVAAVATGAVASNSQVLNRVRRILVPVEPKASNTGLMGGVKLSPEEAKRREDSRRRTTMLTVLGVLLILAFLGAVLFLLLRPGDGSGITPPPVALSVPLKTSSQEQLVKLQLVPGGTSGGVAGASQVAGTPGATTSPGAATTAAGAATTASSSSASAATAAPGTTPGSDYATLPVTRVNTGNLRVASGEVKTTGTRNVPDKPATGTVSFINRGASAKSYGAGAVIYTANGFTYRLVQPVSVGAGNPINGAAGQGSGQIVADKAGPAGNANAPGSRVFADSVAVTIGALAGGSDRAEKFVAPADLQDLEKQLTDKAKAEANGQLKYDPATEAYLIIKSTKPTCDFSKKLNDAAETFNGTCSMTLDAVVYNLKAVTEAVKASFGKDPAYKLDDTSQVQLSDPVLQETNGQLFINVKANGKVISTLNTDTFRDDIAGRPKSEISAIVATKYPQVNLALMNLEGIPGETLPAANRLQINALPDYAMPSITNPSGTPGATNPAGTALPSGGNSQPSATKTASPTK